MLGRGNNGDTLTDNLTAAKYLSTYRVALKELRDQLVTPKESFQSASSALIEGTTSEKSKHPVLKAQWQLEQLRKLIGSKSEEDEIVWRLLKLPALLYWKAMLNEAAKHLQEEWRKVWVALPDKYQQPGEKARMILAFVTDQAGNFLTRRGNQYVVNEILGEKVPFRGDFLNQISQITRYTPETMIDMRFPEEIIQTQ